MRTSLAPRLSRRLVLALGLTAPIARALGRRRYGGTLRLALPFAVGDVDPHAASSPGSALFAPALADPLFALDASGRPYPTLAARLPEPDGNSLRVTLRPGLVTARGRGLDARDVAFSMIRARRFAGRPLLSAWGTPTPAPGDPLAVLVPGANPDALAEALSSPCTAVVPRGFTPSAPDGTGPFKATRSRDGLLLERNPHAARGASFLDRIEIHSVPDLATALRAFESGDADVGFLGAGLHRPRPDALPLHTEPSGWVVLRTGADAGAWGAPGMANRLVASIDPARLAHLGLVPGERSSGDAAWGGPPGDLLVDADSAYLVEVARVLADVLGRPGHEVRTRPVSSRELLRTVGSTHFSLAVDFVRRLGPAPRHSELSLLAAVDPRLADKPPAMPSGDLAALTRTLPLAVVGTFAVQGASAPGFHGLDAWDLGAVFSDR